MKEAYLFLDELPEWLKALAIANIEKCPLQPNVKRSTLFGAICVCFSWDRSNEGWDYWMLIAGVSIRIYYGNINPKTYTEWPKP